MKRDEQEVSRLEAALGYRFHDPELLRTALTPPSTGLAPNNQRLEFLGDAILQGFISGLIYREKPDWDEGAMSKLRGMLVCTESLCEWAGTLDLTLQRGPRSTKQPQPLSVRKPLADAMEALLAAVFLDARDSGRDPQKVLTELIASRFQEDVRRAFLGIWQERDSKTTLQERAAALSLPAPAYDLVERGGPDHAPIFTVRARVGSLEAVATARTLKGAQSAAARLLLGRMGTEGP